MHTTLQIPRPYQIEALHDIEAPLAAMGSLLRELGQVPRPLRLRLHGLVSRMEGILRQGDADARNPASACDLRALLVDLLLEKRALHPETKIKFVVGTKVRPLAALPALECARLLSNCLEHAFACAKPGNPVRIAIREGERLSHIAIAFASDPDKTAPGPSLALQFAQRKTEAWRGHFSMRALKANTTISLALPKRS